MACQKGVTGFRAEGYLKNNSPFVPKRSKFRAVASPNPNPKANWARGVVANVNFAYPPLLGWNLALEFSLLRVNLSPLFSLHVDSSQ